MNTKMFCRYIIAAVMSVLAVSVTAQDADSVYPLHYEASATLGAGDGTFAPYYITAMRHGRFSQKYNAQAEGKVWRPMPLDRRFSYGFGVDLIAGYASANVYERFNAETQSWYTHSERPSSAWIQQLYGEVKYRGVFLTLGLKEHGSALLNQRLSSGDLVESGNARPIPEARAGFVDFQDIPFTRGWVQIQGEISFGKMTDSDWWADRFNYYDYHVTSGQWYNYKRCYFRTNPSKPLSVTVGMQAAATFAGTTRLYYRGELQREDRRKLKLKDFFNMWIPHEDGGEDFYSGNHLGSWDFNARYLFKNGTVVKAYFSWPWEDGSSIGRRNGWDGIWGLEYAAPERGYVSGAVIEYLDFTNQCGPIHYAPGDHPGTSLTSEATGGDDYYNNATYNSYANYGLSIGTPALLASLYQLNGFLVYRANAMRGFHVGIEGTLRPVLDYRVKGGYRKAWGSGYRLLPAPVHLTSLMAEATLRIPEVRGLSVNCMVEVDRGNMPCNAFGAMVTVRYDGIFNINKK